LPGAKLRVPRLLGSTLRLPGTTLRLPWLPGSTLLVSGVTLRLPGTTLRLPGVTVRFWVGEGVAESIRVRSRPGEVACDGVLLVAGRVVITRAGVDVSGARSPVRVTDGVLAVEPGRDVLSMRTGVRVRSVPVRLLPTPRSLRPVAPGTAPFDSRTMVRFLITAGSLSSCGSPERNPEVTTRSGRSTATRLTGTRVPKSLDRTTVIPRRS
jgi:hypothetical protein